MMTLMMARCALEDILQACQSYSLKRMECIPGLTKACYLTIIQRSGGE